MSKKLENHFIVKIFVDTVHDLEKVYDKTVGLIKDSKKFEHTSIVTKVPAAYWDDDVMGMNAAERALARIGRAKDGAKEVQKLYPGDRPDGTVAGLELAEKYITEELARYHGE